MITGFDNEKYVTIQSKKIKERIKMFDKLYLEVGGKLFDDTHAKRVLPGFDLNVKIKMFQELKNDFNSINILLTLENKSIKYPVYFIYYRNPHCHSTKFDKEQSFGGRITSKHIF